MLILIVDDETSLSDVLAAALRDEGHEVLTVPSGETALHHLAFQSALPKLIILDLMLPGMTGVELCMVLQQNPRLAHIPVLIITAVPPAVATLQLCRPVDLLIGHVPHLGRNTSTSQPIWDGSRTKWVRGNPLW